MNRRSHDPLQDLPPDQIPEPSPDRMAETTTASQQLFARQGIHPVVSEPESRRPWFGRTWVETVLGAGLIGATCALALVVLSPFALSPDPSDDLIPADYFRRAAQPPPGSRPPSLDMITDLDAQNFGDLRLGVRNVDDRFGLYFVQPSGVEQEIVAGRKSLAETVSISDAMLINLGDDRFLLVRSGFGELQRWEAFVHDGFGFAISGALSRQIWDAVGQDEVLDRLNVQ